MGPPKGTPAFWKLPSFGAPKGTLAFWGKGGFFLTDDRDLARKVPSSSEKIRRGGPSGTRTPDRPVMSRLL